MTDERLEKIEAPLKEWMDGDEETKAALLLVGELNAKGEGVVRVSRGGGSTVILTDLLYKSIVNDEWLRKVVVTAVRTYIDRNVEPESDSEPDSES